MEIDQVENSSIGIFDSGVGGKHPLCPCLRREISPKSELKITE